MNKTEFDIGHLPSFKPQTKRETQIARTLGGKYKFINCLKKSSTSAVYTVLNKSLDRVEALKVFLNDLTWDNDFLDRFKIEAKICASFAHPNIVTIYHYKKISDFYYFSMLFVDGPTLTKFMKPPVRMHDHDICTHIATICDAIGYAHQRGVIHRDVKASNIMLDQSGKPYIADFGIAKFVASETQTQAHTQTGAIMGTPHYVSPEQAEGHALDGRADIYSLGITLYALLTQRYPFQGNSAMSIILKRLSQEPIPPETYRPDLPPRIKEIIGNTLQVDRRDRYQTTAELAADLTDFVDVASRGTGSGITRAPNFESDPSESKRRRAVLKWLIAAVLVALPPLYLVFQHQDPATAKKVIETPSKKVIETPSALDIRFESDPDDIFHKIDAPQSQKTQRPCTQINGLVADMERMFKAGDYPACLNAAAAANTEFDNLPADMKKRCFEFKKTLEHYQLKANAAIIDRQRQLAELEKIKKNVAHHQLSEAWRRIEAMLVQTDLSPEIEGALYTQRKILKQKLKAKSSRAAQALQSRKQLDRLVDDIAEKYKAGEYPACLSAVSAANTQFDSLSADQKKNCLPIKKKIERLQLQAKAAIKNRQQKIAEIDNIKRKVADGHLEEAIDLIDAMLFETDLSPDIIAILRSQRKVIKRIGGR